MCYLQGFCKLQKPPANYRTAFTRLRSLVRTKHRPLRERGVLQVKRKGKEGVETYTQFYVHQSDNHDPTSAGAAPAPGPEAGRGALRDGGFEIGRVTGSSGARVTVAPWC